MFLTEEEKRMLDGAEGQAVQAAMEFIVRYGEALNAENLLEVNTVYMGPIGCSRPRFMMEIAKKYGGFDGLYAHMGLCKDITEKIPKMKCYTCTLTASLDPDCWEEQAVEEKDYQFAVEGEEFCKRVNMHVSQTCTPYHSGCLPVFGEHIVSMESSAISLYNAVIGARTNCEGVESALASALTGRTPNWGLHLEECRKGTHRIEVAVPVETMMDWGLLGFYFGEKVLEKIPVVTGIKNRPTLNMLKHCGAAAASSGGVEMYHVVGVTPEAITEKAAFGNNIPVETFSFGPKEKRACYEKLNKSTLDEVDFIALGCPHYNLDQLWEICSMLDGKHIAEGVELWITVPYSVKMMARRQGYEKLLSDAGALLISDVCPSLSGICPKGAKSAATDSAKMAKYYPDMYHIPIHFGSMQDCVNAALTGRWTGVLK